MMFAAKRNSRIFLKRSSPSATVLQLSPTATGTGVIPAWLSLLPARILFGHPPHHVCGRSPGSQLRCHKPHMRINMVEERLIASTKVIQARFSVRSLQEPMLRALTVTGESYVAFSAVLRKSRLLGITEVLLLRQTNQIRQRRVHYVAQTIFRVYEVIARIQISAMFKGKGTATFLAEHA